MNLHPLSPMEGPAVRNHLRTQSAAVLTVALALGAVACQRQPTGNIELQSNTAAIPQSQPLSVRGCLQRGPLTENMWVLLSSAPGGYTNERGATYQLVGGDGDILNQYNGHQVEVSGVLESDQQVAATS